MGPELKHIFYDPSLLHATFIYNPDSGIFTWRKRAPDAFAAVGGLPDAKIKMLNSRYAGKRAFTAKNTGGYFHCKLLNRVYLAHRAAWVLHTGEQPDFIDHINGDVSDNRINNLRNVSKAINSRNRAISSNNTSGFPGVSFARGKQKWQAYANENGRNIHLGFFETKEAAAARRMMHNAEHGYIVRPIDD